MNERILGTQRQGRIVLATALVSFTAGAAVLGVGLSQQQSSQSQLEQEQAALVAAEADVDTTQQDLVEAKKQSLDAAESLESADAESLVTLRAAAEMLDMGILGRDLSLEEANAAEEIFAARLRGAWDEANALVDQANLFGDLMAEAFDQLWEISEKVSEVAADPRVDA